MATDPTQLEVAPASVTTLIAANGWYAMLGPDAQHTTFHPLVGWGLGTVGGNQQVVGLHIDDAGQIAVVENDPRFLGYACSRSWPDT